MKAIGIVIFAIQGIGLMLPNRASYDYSPKFRRLFFRVYNFVVFFYLLVGFVITSALGESVREVVLFNFYKDYKFVFLMEIIYSMIIFVSNQINLFPLFLTIYKHPRLVKLMKRKSKWNQYFLKLSIRFAVMTLAYLVAFLVKDFVSFISLIGSMLFTLTAIVIPITLYFTHFSRKGQLGTYEKI